MILPQAPSPNASPPRRGPGLLGVAGFLFAVAASLAAGTDLATQNPNKIKAAYLLNFTRYVTWPGEPVDGAGSSWVIGVLGDDPFGPVLEQTFAAHAGLRRGFTIHRAGAVEDLPRCHIVYVALGDPKARETALAALKKTATLTVGDAPDFLAKGGIIRFETTDRVRMSINLDQARAGALVIQAKMLEVSYGVLENGELRRLR